MTISFSTAAQHTAYNGLCFALNSLVPHRGRGFEFDVTAESDRPCFNLARHGGQFVHISVDTFDWSATDGQILEQDAVISFSAVVGFELQLPPEAVVRLMQINRSLQIGMVASETTGDVFLVYSVAWSISQPLFSNPQRFNALLVELCGVVTFLRKELKQMGVEHP